MYSPKIILGKLLFSIEVHMSLVKIRVRVDPFGVWGNEIFMNQHQWFQKQFTEDYMSNYMIGGRGKFKVYLRGHDDFLDFLIKTKKDGQSAITRGWPRVVPALCMDEDTIWPFRFTS
ncbi:LRR receptor-like serine/threonine-protein kinase RPK2 [Hordeum vulgare]|nr:LRR receptor-like serine/threonine-protein kinase RPK2 [Hordeum vulgare]